MLNASLDWMRFITNIFLGYDKISKLVNFIKIILHTWRVGGLQWQ
jgi:hypothetical protein